MDPRLLRYYNQELRYLREMGGEFAREFPKIAGRLGMEGMEVSDPYVERLIEGCAFLAARVQLKQDAEFPELAQRLIEMISPNLAAPHSVDAGGSHQVRQRSKSGQRLSDPARQRPDRCGNRAQPHSLRVPNSTGRGAHADPRRRAPSTSSAPPTWACRTCPCRSGRAAACV